jgi:small subunit ribosomal protein S4e
MTHLKRHKIPKNWPIPRKGTTFVVRPASNLKTGVPILIVLRDMLKLAQNKKEVKRALHLKQILVNGKIVRDEKNSITLFDVVTIIPSKENYRLNVSENGKFKLEKVSDKEANTKISKVINKKKLKGNKTQVNLSGGMNILSKEKCNTNDSLLINLKDNKIEKCIEMKEKSNALVFAGKHAGKKGVIQKIDNDHKIVELKTEERSIHALIKQIIITE